MQQSLSLHLVCTCAVHTPENHGGVEYVNGKEENRSAEKEAKSKDIVLDDIVIDLKK